MKGAEIQVIYKNQILFKSKSVRMHENSYTSLRILEFIGVKLNEKISLSEDVEIKIVILLEISRTEKVELFEYNFLLYEEVLFSEKSDKLKIKGQFVPKFFNSVYDQKLVDALVNRGRIEYGNITSINSGVEKRYALIARNYCFGLPKKVESKNYEIDSNRIFEEYDFYLQLSDKLIGNTGFFACGLSSLEESLIELSHHKSCNFSLSILNSNRLKAILGESIFQSTFDVFDEFKINCLFK